ncbi:MAG: hypothetical protein PHS07_00335 [Patescibacteria group bacterium]|nr:hypothetical protein [Patescibacteria group bacterium]
MTQNPIDEIKKIERTAQEKIQLAQNQNQQKITQFKQAQETLIDQLEKEIQDDFDALNKDIKNNNQIRLTQADEKFKQDFKKIEKLDTKKNNQAQKIILDYILNKS